MEIYHARWVLPVTGAPIEGGALVVDRGRIVDVGKAQSVSGETVRDLGDCIMLPGFVNAHAHLELTCYRGRVPAGTLWQWFEQLMALRRRPEAAEQEREAVHLGARESLAAGVTCVGDISRTGMHVEALHSSPIRKVCFLELISGAAAPPNDIDSLAALLESNTKLAQPQRLVIGISPHTLYTVTRDDLAAAAALAAEHATPLTMHLLETAEEAEWLRSGGGFLQAFLSRHHLPTASVAGRVRALALLHQTGLLGQRPLLAHVNYLDDLELGELAASRASVVWCPRSHRFFGHPPHRWREMLDAGINVCIGTDSMASNETLSILDELRNLRRMAPEVTPDLILEMGTSRGAAGLGLDSHLGSFRSGMCADFVAVPWDPAGPADPVLNLLDGSKPVSGVWIGGAELSPHA